MRAGRVSEERPGVVATPGRFTTSPWLKVARPRSVAGFPSSPLCATSMRLCPIAPQ